LNNSRFFSPEGISPAPGTSHGFIASPGANGVSLLVAGAAIVVVSHGFGGGGVDMSSFFAFPIPPKNLGDTDYTQNKRERERKKERRVRDKAVVITPPLLSLSLCVCVSLSFSSSLFFFFFSLFSPSRDLLLQNWRRENFFWFVVHFCLQNKTLNKKIDRVKKKKKAERTRVKQNKHF